MCESFYAWNLKPEVRWSASGGAFWVLATQVINQGGLVVGAAFAENMAVRHLVIDRLSDLRRLQGVKYVHGRIGREVYDSIRTALSNRRTVLFTGLPCQVAAVRKLFGAPENLILCDLVCYGAPQVLLWRKYIEWIQNRKGEKLRHLNPRDKRHGWGRRTYVRYEWANGDLQEKLSVYDPYSQAFYSALPFLPACYTCQFKGVNSRADITIGDGWGAEKYVQDECVLRNGVSLVVVRSQTGERLLQSTELERIAVDETWLRLHNRPIFESAHRPPLWNDFQSDMQTLPFEALVRKYHLQRSKSRQFLGRMKRVVIRLIRR